MQFHANYEPKKYIAGFMAQHYKGHSVQIIQGCCRKCLKHGSPTIFNLSTHPWSRLLEEGTIDPYQTASVFFPGSQFHSPHFKKPVLDLQAPELPCKYPATCEQTCLLCSGFIDGPGMEMKDWPGFKVHPQCTTRCQYTNCNARLPDFPAYISYQRSQFVCEEHLHCKNLQGMSAGFQRMSIDGCGAFTPQLVSKARKEGKEEKSGKTPKPVPLPLPPTLRERKPQEPEEADTPKVKKTVHFKRHPGRAKADKYDGDRSQVITNYFRPPKELARISASKAKANPKADPKAGSKVGSKADGNAEPRRFIRNKLGTVYAYWKGENAHCIETDKILFKANYPSAVSGRRVYAAKFDFTPPKHFFPAEQAEPAEQAGNSTSAPAGGE